MSAFPTPLQGLLAPRAYPHVVHQVDLIETHISWVLLTGEWVYKIKRPVRYAFVDQRSAAHRAFLCHEELRLNRRFAPDLYVSVCPITESDGEVRMEGCGRVIENAVKMRQFPSAEVLDRLLESERVGTKELAQFGGDLARIHAALPVATTVQDWGRPKAVRAQILENLEQCAAAAAVFDGTGTVNALRPALEASLGLAESWMDIRRRQGRVRECHGDLHCGNIVRRGTQLLAFDCLEFDPALRWEDVAQEVATLLADLLSRNQHELAAAFLDGYLTRAGDYQACRLLNLYQAHRSLVRAKVMALNGMHFAREHGDTTDIRRQYERYLDCAKGSLSAHRPTLILMHGLSGSGKTWLAQRLAARLTAVYLSSDLERKRLAGPAETVPPDSRQTLDRYSPEARAQVYQQLAKCATDTLAGGYTTIVDATFASREQRTRFQALAANLGVPVRLVHCKASPELLRARIDERLTRNSDLSEADQKVLEWQQRHTDLIAPEERLEVFEVNTADPLSLERLSHSLARVSNE